MPRMAAVARGGGGWGQAAAAGGRVGRWVGGLGGGGVPGASRAFAGRRGSRASRASRPRGFVECARQRRGRGGRRDLGDAALGIARSTGHCSTFRWLAAPLDTPCTRRTRRARRRASYLEHERVSVVRVPVCRAGDHVLRITPRPTRGSWSVRRVNKNFFRPSSLGSRSTRESNSPASSSTLKAN